MHALINSLKILEDPWAWETIILTLFYMHANLYLGLYVRMTIAVLSDNLFVLSNKCKLNWAAKTHILFTRPDSMPTSYSHNTQISVLSVLRLWETCNFVPVHLRVSLSGSLQPCGFLCLRGKREMYPCLGPALFVEDVDGRCRLLLWNGPLSHT